MVSFGSVLYLTNIPTGAGSRRLCISPAADRVYVTNRSDRRIRLAVNAQSISTGHPWLLDKAHIDGEARSAPAQGLPSSQGVSVSPCLIRPKAPGRVLLVLRYEWQPAALRQLHRLL